MANQVLVTGGCGYIGSHAVRALRRAGYTPLIVDNLSQGHAEAALGEKCLVGDLGDASFLEELFETHPIHAVMHFASRCYVGESVENPQLYYEENLGNAVRLLGAMLRRGVRYFIFSSSCATYGNPVRTPMDESHPQNPVNPYGETKYFVERILREYGRAYGLHSVCLRYFNAAGASLDGALGESHQPETHLIPRILETALGCRPEVEIYGDDYQTPDGTCVRDYIHVEDLAAAHVAALQWLEFNPGAEAFNLGTGRGYSVLEVIGKVREITGRAVPMQIRPRRLGDPAELVADPSKAGRLLKWCPASSDLTTIVRSAWEWELNRKF